MTSYTLRSIKAQQFRGQSHANLLRQAAIWLEDITILKPKGVTLLALVPYEDDDEKSLTVIVEE